MSEFSLFDDLPAGWETTTLGDACARGGGEIQTGPFGSQLHASDYVASGIPSIMPQNIGDNRVVVDGIAQITPEDAARLDRYRVRKGDIVYSRRGDVERRVLIREHEEGWLCGTGCLRVRLGEKGADPSYAAFYLGHPAVREWIVRHAHGATMPNLNTSILSELPLVLPPLPEQRAIASVLGALDDRIELNRRMNETLEALAQSLFKAWFVDAIRDTKPKGWRESTIGDICEFAYGKALKEDMRRPGSIPVFGSNGQVGWHDEALVKGPGIIVGRKGNPGIVTWAPTDFFPIDTTFYVVPQGECRSLYFLFYALRAHDLASLGADSAVPGLNRNMAYLSEQILPTLDVQDGFDERVRPLFARIHHNDEESRTLAALRDALLRKLLSGELRVPAAVNLVDAHT